MSGLFTAKFYVATPHIAHASHARVHTEPNEAFATSFRLSLPSIDVFVLTRTQFPVSRYELSASRRRVPAAFWFVTTVAKPASPWLALQKNVERIGLIPTASPTKPIKND